MDERSFIKVPLPPGLTLGPTLSVVEPPELLESRTSGYAKLVPLVAAALVTFIVIAGAIVYLFSSRPDEVVQLPDQETYTVISRVGQLQPRPSSDASGDGSAEDDPEADLLPLEATGRRWIKIHPGSFLMGSPMTETGRGNDERPHKVTLTKTYVISPTEVTQQEFRDAMGYNPSQFASCGSECPVEDVSWHEAVAYSNSLSTKAGLELCYVCSGDGPESSCTLAPRHRTPYDCKGYRLPTEAEWENAARAGTKTATFGGELGQGLLACEQPHAILDPIAWFCGNSNNRIQRVGTKEPNRWGLQDVLGNVLEWCHDRYDDYPTGDIIDPWGAATGSSRVFRGGSCHHYANLARAGSRGQSTPDDHSRWLGFRLVRSMN